MAWQIVTSSRHGTSFITRRIVEALTSVLGKFMPDNSITSQGLTKIFGHFRAVDTLNLDINGGELFGLLGPNGAGKTTTVRMLCTLIEPTLGSATVAGLDIRKDAGCCEAQHRRCE